MLTLQRTGIEGEGDGGRVLADGYGDGVERLVHRGKLRYYQTAHHTVLVLTAEHLPQPLQHGLVLGGGIGRGDASVPLCHALIQGAEAVVERYLGVVELVGRHRIAQHHCMTLARDA